MAPGGAYQAVRIFEKRRHDAGDYIPGDISCVNASNRTTMLPSSSSWPAVVNSLGVRKAGCYVEARRARWRGRVHAIGRGYSLKRISKE